MNTKAVIETRDAKLPDDIDSIKQLWTDYLTWGNDQMQLLYGVHPHNPTEAVDQDIIRKVQYVFKNGVGYNSKKLFDSVKGKVGFN